MSFAHRFARHLVQTPRGQAYVLRQMAQAKGVDQTAAFVSARETIVDAELGALLSAHAETQARYIEELNEHATELRLQADPAPPHLSYVALMDRALGGYFSDSLSSSSEIAEAYLLRLVCEERALSQYRAYANAFAAVGQKEITFTLQRIVRENERHLRAMHAVATRYAPSRVMLAATLSHWRRFESRVFGELERATVRFAVVRGITPLPGVLREVWLTIVRVGDWLELDSPSGYSTAAI